MFRILWLLVTTIFRCLHARRALLLENLVLRQQLAVLKRKHPKPRLRAFDKIFWVLARRFWSGWKQALIVVSPETVVGWHRAGFKLYWRATSRARRVIGRKRISKEVRNLIFRMVAENATWGVPYILNVADLWPDSVLEKGFLKQGFLIESIAWLERWSYKNAAYVNAMTEGMRDTLLREKGLPPEKVLFLPNG